MNTFWRDVRAFLLGAATDIMGWVGGWVLLALGLAGVGYGALTGMHVITAVGAVALLAGMFFTIRRMF